MRRAASEKPAATLLPFAPVAGGVCVRLRVTPRARRNGIEGFVADAEGGVRLKVAVSAAAEDGRANLAVLELLAREWRLPRSSLSLKIGAGDRRKSVAIAGDPDQLMAALLTWSVAQQTSGIASK
jgi:uncharacterized protein YggU (UPF0235/DUF167 family)